MDYKGIITIEPGQRGGEVCRVAARCSFGLLTGGPEEFESDSSRRNRHRCFGIRSAGGGFDDEGRTQRP
jgi:hypothetical protein